jgi:peptidyl-prolyl cis-trans isomerase B (cyclophilin B)
MKSLVIWSASIILLAFVGSRSVSGAEPVIVDLTTSEGVIRLELDSEKAPKSVANFVAYVESGHYEGTVFHRVIPGFMIQGGGMDMNMREKKTSPPVINEGGNGLKNVKYTVAMARTPDPDSATSQFFINVADNRFLNKAESQDGFGYAVFGKVTAGTEVVDKIAAKKTTLKAGMDDVPVEPITITSVKVVKGE